MTAEFADLPDDQRQAIERLVAEARPLSDRQRERLQLLFRGGDPPDDDAGPEGPAPDSSANCTASLSPGADIGGWR